MANKPPAQGITIDFQIGSGASAELVVRDIDFSKVKPIDMDITGSGDLVKQTALYGATGEVTFTVFDLDDVATVKAGNGLQVTVTQKNSIPVSPATITAVTGILEVPTGVHAPHGQGNVITFPVIIHVNAIPSGLYPA